LKNKLVRSHFGGRTDRINSDHIDHVRIRFDRTYERSGEELYQDIPETTGRDDGAVFLDGLRIPDVRSLRSFGSSEDEKVINSFLTWLDSNGMGNIQSRFGRSVSKTKLPKRFSKLSRKRIGRFGRKSGDRFLLHGKMTWKNVLRLMNRRIIDQNKDKKQILLNFR